MKPEQFGAWLREARLQAGLTGTDLAQRSGITSVQISNIERGKTRNPKPMTKQRLIKALAATDKGALVCLVPNEQTPSPRPTEPNTELEMWHEFARSLERLEREKWPRFRDFAEGFGQLCVRLANAGLLDPMTARRIRDIGEVQLDGW